MDGRSETWTTCRLGTEACAVLMPSGSALIWPILQRKLRRRKHEGQTNG